MAKPTGTQLQNQLGLQAASWCASNQEENTLVEASWQAWADFAEQFAQLKANEGAQPHLHCHLRVGGGRPGQKTKM